MRLTLTAPKLIARIMWWLEGTASGTLHGEDQPLEPLLFDPNWDLIVPGDLLDGSDPDESVLAYLLLDGLEPAISHVPRIPPRRALRIRRGEAVWRWS